eukprot:sb/3461890/
MFDGGFKSKPVVALRGSSSNAPRNVVEANRRKRETRDTQRRGDNAVLQLQTLLRGWRLRGRLREECRVRHDQTTYPDNIRPLLYCYNPTVDHARLVELCSRLDNGGGEFSRATLSYRIIQDIHQQVVVRGVTTKPDLVESLNTTTAPHRADTTFKLLVAILDKHQHPALVSLLHTVVNVELVIPEIVLNPSLSNHTTILQSLSLQGCDPAILVTSHTSLICTCLDTDFNSTLERVVGLLRHAALSSDLLLGVLQAHRPVFRSEGEEDSSSEEEEERERYNFNCLTDMELSVELVFVIIAKYRVPVARCGPLIQLAFNTTYLRSLLADTMGGELVAAVVQGRSLTADQYRVFVPRVTVLSALLTSYISSTHDSDILEERLLTRDQLITLCITARDLSLALASMDLIAISGPLKVRSAFLTASRHTSVPGGLEAAHWVECWVQVTALSRELYRRSTRLNVEVEWRREDVNVSEECICLFLEEEAATSNVSLAVVKELYVLQRVPFTIPFKSRVSLFHKILDKDVLSTRGAHDQFNTSASVQASIRRDFVYEDAFIQLAESRAPNLKHRLTVKLINFTGLDEAGVDGGGLFKEFVSCFIREAFNPNRGFFIETEGLLHPNPMAVTLYPDYKKHYYLIGRVLGKAIYEKLLVDLPLAPYFLEQLLGSIADINYLRSLDPTLYRTLLSLRSYTAQEIADLELGFVVDENTLGKTANIELKPGGSGIKVTKDNVIEYIHLVADHRLNRQTRSHCRAFTEGLYSVLSVEWLGMFSFAELHLLICGSESDIDLADLRANTVYYGIYKEDHQCVEIFWQVLGDLSPKQRRLFLAFVTSSDRTPLLGFGSLNPLFAVHSAGEEEDRLPTASTCMNLLKLPEYRSYEVMKSKLVYVIESGAGFELS